MVISPEVMKWVRELNHEPGSPLALERPCLLVLDMQNDFLRHDGQIPVWGGAKALPCVSRLLEAFRRHRLPVVFTRHICIQPHAHQGKLAIMRHIRNPENFLRDGHVGAEIHSDTKPLAGEAVIKKYRYSAFYDSPLGTLLNVWQVREVVVTGVATNICCETTAHDAFFRGFDVLFTIDATGGTSEEAHLASLRNIQTSYGKIVLAEEVERALMKERCE